MAVRKEVSDFVEAGPLPAEDEASEEQLVQLEHLLEAIKAPVSVDEAKLLTREFGVDSCYGLAWTLLHLIETAPDFPIEVGDEGSENEWITRLSKRREA